MEPITKSTSTGHGDIEHDGLVQKVSGRGTEDCIGNRGVAADYRKRTLIAFGIQFKMSGHV
jgi:hypothetical protein